MFAVTVSHSLESIGNVWFHHPKRLQIISYVSKRQVSSVVKAMVAGNKHILI